MWFTRCLMIFGASLVIVNTAGAQQFSGPEARLRTRVTPDSARAVALARVPRGTVQASQLRLERGVLVYIYDISVPGKEGLEELQVSAANAEVVSVEHLGDTGALTGSEARGAAMSTRRDGRPGPRP
jgi:hypothetical protein